jgi:hypothetical protein
MANVIVVQQLKNRVPQNPTLCGASPESDLVIRKKLRVAGSRSRS